MYKLVCQKPAPFLAVLNNNNSVFVVLRIYNFEALLTKQPLLEELTAYMWPPSIHLSRLLSHTYCCMQFSVAGARRPTAARRRDYDDGGSAQWFFCYDFVQLLPNFALLDAHFS